MNETDRDMQFLAAHLVISRVKAESSSTWRQGTVTDHVLDGNHTIGVTVRGHDSDGAPADSAPFRVKTFAVVTNGASVWLLYLGDGAWLCFGSTL